jgi:cytochrome c oxidase subunit III
MTPVRTLDVSGLAPYNISNRAPTWWGQVLLCAIEGSMFCILIAIYFYLRLGVDVWPPHGARELDPALSSIALLPLLLSAIGSYWASEAAKKDSRSGMLGGLILNLVLAAVFLALRFVNWGSLNYNWASDAHGTVVWTILFLHTFDMVADLLFTLALVIIVAAGRSGPKQRLGVHVDSVVWYFLVGIWLPLYAVLVWGPRLVGGS